MSVSDLPAVNASLNGSATVLILLGYWFIRRGRERAHKATMLSAFVVSIAFLACYVVYHLSLDGVSKPFTGPSPVREAYYALLISHVLLAMTVPVLTVGTIAYGLLDRRDKHRAWARWTLPIWLYVSATGVVIYFVLYQLYP